MVNVRQCLAQPLAMDPGGLELDLEFRAKNGILPKAVVLMHVYAQTADMERISDLCARHGAPLIDASETVGGTYRGRQGTACVFSFKGNEISGAQV